LHYQVGWYKHHCCEHHSFENSCNINEKKVWKYHTLFEMLLVVQAKKVPKRTHIDSSQAREGTISVAMEKYFMTIKRHEGKGGMDLTKTHLLPIAYPFGFSLFGCLLLNLTGSP
jgi:hypothetical protein